MQSRDTINTSTITKTVTQTYDFSVMWDRKIGMSPENLIERVWVRNLVSHFEGGTQIEGFWERSVEEDIWT
jgi:hypothetical protein